MRCAFSRSYSPDLALRDSCYVMGCTSDRRRCPDRHSAPLRTIVDTALAQFDEVWAAGRHPHYVFPTSFDELVRITSGTPTDVGA